MHLVLMSGGIDSSVLLHAVKRAASKTDKVYALYIDYGNKHIIEKKFAKKQAEDAGAIFIEHSLKLDQLVSSSLTTSNIEVPDGLANARQTVVPYRNTFFLVVAAAFANKYNCDHIYIGATREDSADYPDCRPLFFEYINKTLMTAGPNHSLTVNVPFLNSRKEHIISKGVFMGVNLANTYSCYKGQEIHCGVCPTCLVRKKGFEAAGIEDPTKYINDDKNINKKAREQ